MNSLRLVAHATIVLALNIVSCKSSDHIIQVTPGYYKSAYTIPFNLNEPSGVFGLPKELNEISGLTFIDSTQLLAAINDERAIIYLIDKEKGSIVETIDFGGKGDYEAITSIGKTIYAIESNGNIHLIDVNDKREISQLNTSLNIKDNVEGATIDKNSGNLILACKESNNDEIRHLHFADKTTGQVFTNKSIKINATAIVKKLNIQLDSLSDEDKLKVTGRVNAFSPSGIAIQPTTGNFFILSSRGTTLMILDPEFKPLALALLSEVIHAQPEGICFGPDGTLYISNEGRGKKARIYRYDVH